MLPCVHAGQNRMTPQNDGFSSGFPLIPQCPVLVKRNCPLQPFERCCFFNTKLKGHHQAMFRCIRCKDPFSRRVPSERPRLPDRVLQRILAAPGKDAESFLVFFGGTTRPPAHREKNNMPSLVESEAPFSLAQKTKGKPLVEVQIPGGFVGHCAGQPHAGRAGSSVP